MINNILLFINAVACGAIALQLIFYRRDGTEHKFLPSFFAWLLIVATASVTIRIVVGDYHYANWSETFINVALCFAVIASRGNVMNLVTPFQR